MKFEIHQYEFRYLNTAEWQDISEIDLMQRLYEFYDRVVPCMSSKGFGQFGHKNKRGFQIPNTFFQSVKQPLVNNYISCVEAMYFS